MLKEKAFTLVEMIVTIAILGSISIVLASVFSSSERQYRVGIKKINQNENAALAVRDFEKITRGATSIITAEPTNLVFLSYLKNDNHPAPSKISYYLEGTTLYRSLILPVVQADDITYPDTDKVVKKIADNVRSEQIFSYYSSSNSELSFPIQTDVVKMIKMAVEVDENISDPPEAAIQSTAVHLRNLKTNL